jgi:hypothetical protein
LRQEGNRKAWASQPANTLSYRRITGAGKVDRWAGKSAETLEDFPLCQQKWPDPIVKITS